MQIYYKKCIKFSVYIPIVKNDRIELYPWSGGYVKRKMGVQGYHRGSQIVKTRFVLD